MKGTTWNVCLLLFVCLFVCLSEVNYKKQYFSNILCRYVQLFKTRTCVKIHIDNSSKVRVKPLLLQIERFGECWKWLMLSSMLLCFYASMLLFTKIINYLSFFINYLSFIYKSKLTFSREKLFGGGGA